MEKIYSGTYLETFNKITTIYTLAENEKVAEQNLYDGKLVNSTSVVEFAPMFPEDKNNPTGKRWHSMIEEKQIPISSQENWTEDKVVEILGGLAYFNFSKISEWTEVYDELMNDETELEITEQISNNSNLSWSKDDVFFQIIAPLISLVNFPIAGFEVSINQEIESKIGYYQFKDNIDLLIGTSKKKYFMLGMYERQEGNGKSQLEKSPEGQHLLSLYALSQKNNDGLPVFGAMVIDNFWWYFTMLHGDKYVFSEVFIGAGKLDLTRNIFLILKGLKTILREIKEENPDIFL